MAQFVLQLLDRRLREKERRDLKRAEAEARVDMRLRMQDAISPLIEGSAIALTMATEERRRSASQVITGAMVAAKEIIEADRVRVCLFVVKREADGTNVRLEPRPSFGRQGTSRSIFYEHTEAGDEVFRMLRDRRYARYESLDEEWPPGWDSLRPRDYKTFISTPVAAGEQIYGMLTADAPIPKSLTLEDVSFLQVAAQVVALGMLLEDDLPSP